MQLDGITGSTQDITAVELSPETIPTKCSSPKQFFFRNIVSQTLLFTVTIFLGMWFTPYLKNHLGIELFGMVPLAYSFLAYASVLTVAVTGTLGRFVTIHLEKRENEQANLYFNTQFTALVVFISCLIPGFAIFSFFVPNIITVPVGHERDVQLLFLSILLSFVFSGLAGPLLVSTFAKHRFDLRNIYDLTINIIRVGLVVVFFRFLTAQAWYVGLGAFTGTAIGAVLAYMYFRRLTPELAIRFRNSFDRAKFREMNAMGLWMAINGVGMILYLNIDLIVLNKVLGTAAGGRYSVVSQLSTNMRTLAAGIAAILIPVVLGYYARKDYDGLVRVSARAVKFMGLASAIPLGLLCGFSKPFLSSWMGADFVSLSPLMWLIMSHLVINLSVLPLFAINTATNRMKVPAVVTVFGGLINLVLAIALSSKTSLGIYGVALAGAIALTLKNALFTPWYASRVLGVSPLRFLPAITAGIVVFASFCVSAYLISEKVQLNNLLIIAVAGVAITAILLPLFYFMLLNKGDREFLFSVLPFRLRK